MQPKDLRVALANDHLNTWGGGERVIEIFGHMFPQAKIYALTHDPEQIGKHLKAEVVTSFIQRIPFGAKKYKWFLGLLPKAVESLKIPPCDLVLSGSSGFIKGLHQPPGSKHVCYIHTTTRYLTVDRQYFKSTAPKFTHPIMPMLLKYLTRKDLEGAMRPDAYIANSTVTAGRVKQYYNRDVASIVFPPIDNSRFFREASDSVGDYYLVVSRMVPYKRVDLAIEACNRLGRKLIIVGSGPEEEALRAMAGPTIEFKGIVTDEEVRHLYANCKALLFTAFEDAGMTPIECMACGRPVIAFGQGGALESVSSGVSGIFFDRQDADSLCHAIQEFEHGDWAASGIMAYAERFGVEVFKAKVWETIEKTLSAGTERV